MDQQELRLRQQVQEGNMAQECLEYLRPKLDKIRQETLLRMEQPIIGAALQDSLMDCRAAVLGCRLVEDELAGLVNSGRMAERTLKGGEYDG